MCTSTPKEPLNHGFKKTTSTDHIVDIMLPLRPNYISRESVKDTAIVGENINTVKEISHTIYSKLLMKKPTTLTNLFHRICT